MEVLKDPPEPPSPLPKRPIRSNALPLDSHPAQLEAGPVEGCWLADLGAGEFTSAPEEAPILLTATGVPATESVQLFPTTAKSTMRYESVDM